MHSRLEPAVVVKSLIGLRSISIAPRSISIFSILRRLLLHIGGLQKLHWPPATSRADRYGGALCPVFKSILLIAPFRRRSLLTIQNANAAPGCGLRVLSRTGPIMTGARLSVRVARTSELRSSSIGDGLTPSASGYRKLAEGCLDMAERVRRKISTMAKTFVFASALFLGAAAFGVAGETALAAEAKSVDAMKKACEREATLKLYTGKQRSRFIRQCLAGSRPPDPVAMPTVTPLTNPRSTFRGGTAPSNAPVAPSAPVIGSTGTSTTGSSATSISGSSGTSIGSSRR